MNSNTYMPKYCFLVSPMNVEMMSKSGEVQIYGLMIKV